MPVRKIEWAIRIGSLIVIVLGWELVGQLQLMDPLFLSHPTAMWKALWQPYEVGSIFSHLLMTAWMGFISYTSAVVMGIPTGLLLGRIPTLRKLIDPYLVAFYVTPTFTLLPLLLVLLGTGEIPLFVVVFTAVFSQVAINVISGAESVDSLFLEAGRAYGASRLQLFWKVVFPATLPHIVAACRAALGRGLVVLVFAEFYLGAFGLGFFAAWSGQTLRTEALFATIVILMMLGLSADEGLKFVRRRLFPWGSER